MTYEQLSEATFVAHHSCSCCGGPVGYLIHPEMAAAVFNSACDCGERGESFRLLTHEELAAISPLSSEVA